MCRHQQAAGGVSSSPAASVFVGASSSLPSARKCIRRSLSIERVSCSEFHVCTMATTRDESGPPPSPHRFSFSAFSFDASILNPGKSLSARVKLHRRIARNRAGLKHAQLVKHGESRGPQSPFQQHLREGSTAPSRHAQGWQQEGQQVPTICTSRAMEQKTRVLHTATATSCRTTATRRRGPPRARASSSLGKRPNEEPEPSVTILLHTRARAPTDAPLLADAARRSAFPVED